LRFSKHDVAGFATALTLIAVAAAPKPAHAEVVSLVCGPSIGNIWPYSEFLTIDLSAGTVVQWTSLHAHRQTPPTPATITEDEVNFQTGSEGSNSGGDFTLNRDTGKLVVYSYENQTQRVFKCEKASATHAPLF
jgi:hypothetical protein